MFKPPIEFRPFCIKASESELACLPEDFINDQKKRCLIITKGEKGSEIFLKYKKYTIRPNRTIKAIDTTGAGDTFIAYLISSYLKSGNLIEGAMYASEKTIKFLEQKNLPTSDAYSILSQRNFINLILPQVASLSNFFAEKSVKSS